MLVMVAEAALNQVHQEHWHAELKLEVSRTPRGSRLTACNHRGPLYVQKPFYPEGPQWAHIYPLHPPGGVVSGDQLDIQVDAGPDTGVLLTTPGAARMYRARSGGRAQIQKVHLRVAAGAAIEWFPLETIVYSGARVELETTVELAADARFCAWEINCFGLPASAENYCAGSFCQRYSILREGRPVFVERLQLAPEKLSLLQSRAGLQGMPVSGFFLIGPVQAGQPELLDSLRQLISELGVEHRAAVGYNGEFVLGRYLGPSAEQARKLFGNWWRLLRPQVMGRAASPPRIWYT